MTFDNALTAFTQATISEQLKAAYEVKLAEAKKYLGDKYALAQPVKRLEKKRN